MLDYEKADLYMYADSQVEVDLRIHACAKEPETIWWLENLVQPGDILFDVGANVGSYSLVAAYRKAVVFAFEPVFKTFTKLCENISVNNFQRTIFPIQMALSNFSGEGFLQLSSEEVGAANHKLHAQSFGDKDQRVMAITMEDFVDQFNVMLPNHIKIDVDGHERQVLLGMKGILRSPLLRSMCIELDENDKTLTDIIVDCGFSVVMERVHESFNPEMPPPNVKNVIFKRR